MTALTQNFQLEFLAPGEPVKNTRAVLERFAKSVDAALTRGGVAPPNAQDLVALAGRTTALENAFVRPTPTTITPLFGSAHVTGFASASYFRDAGGVGHLSSVLQLPTTTTAWPANQRVFTLPAGYRPPVKLGLMLPIEGPGGRLITRFDMATDGTFYPISQLPTGAVTYLFLDTVHYLTAAS